MIISKYKIKSVEDPFSENDWPAWNMLMKSIKNIQTIKNIQILGFLSQGCP